MVDGGRIAAVEVMVVNDRIAELIRESRAEDIPAAIKDGDYYDMQTLTQALIDLALGGLVDRETATNAAPNAHDFHDRARARGEGAAVETAPDGRDRAACRDRSGGSRPLGPRFQTVTGAPTSAPRERCRCRGCVPARASRSGAS